MTSQPEPEPERMRIVDAFGRGCEVCDWTGHVCCDDDGEHPGITHPWSGLSGHADACDHGGGMPCPSCSLAWLTGPQRVREAVRRDRGELHGPELAEALHAAQRSSYPGWPGPPLGDPGCREPERRLPSPPLRECVGRWLVERLFCPACITPKIIPWHRLRGCGRW